MRCPYCSHEETQVKDSRPSEDGYTIKRRRYCTECDARYTTVERHYIRPFNVIKKNGERVPFVREKLFRSLELCLRKRPLNFEDIEKIVNNVTRKLEALNENDISSIKVGEFVLQALKEVDNVAYIRYASVYMDFSHSKDFQNMINSLDLTNA